ncbi:MAG: phosphatidylglycerophosphatase A [Phycisphaerae bacterium]|jgi:phosphatidylglycerophosphatase A
MKRLLTSCFGLGLLPICPGTFGSLPPAVLFYLLVVLDTSFTVISIVFIIWAIAAAIICVAFSPAVIARTGKIDPGEIVIDEVAGQCVAFIPAILFTPLEPLFIAGLGLVLFRLFDITKPFPIRKLEKLPAGWGIVADDLLAGVFAAVILIFVTRFTGYLYPAI